MVSKVIQAHSQPAKYLVHFTDGDQVATADATLEKGGARSLSDIRTLKEIFFRRKIERATYEPIPVLYTTGGTHPDHDSINTFHKRFLPPWEPLFVQILQIAHGLGILKRGDVSIDGTKLLANASKHQAMSWA